MPEVDFTHHVGPTETAQHCVSPSRSILRAVLVAGGQDTRSTSSCGARARGTRRAATASGRRTALRARPPPRRPSDIQQVAQRFPGSWPT